MTIGESLVNIMKEDHDLQRIWSWDFAFVLSQYISFHKKWQADRKNMEEDAKAESKRSLLHLRDGVVIHYFMQNDHNNYQLLQRFSYKKWLSTKLSPDQLSDKDFMDPLLHGFRRFVEIRLGIPVW